MEVEVEMGLWGTDRLEEEQRLLEVVQKNGRMLHPLCRTRPVCSSRQHPYSVYCRGASQIVAVVLVVEEEEGEEEGEQQQQQQQGRRQLEEDIEEWVEGDIEEEGEEKSDEEDQGERQQDEQKGEGEAREPAEMARLDSVVHFLFPSPVLPLV